MQTIIDIAHAIYNAGRVAVLAFALGFQLFYLVGPLVLGAAVGCLGLWALVRYIAWPVARGGFNLLVFIGRSLFGPSQKARVEQAIDTAWEATEPVAAK